MQPLLSEVVGFAGRPGLFDLHEAWQAEGMVPWSG